MQIVVCLMYNFVKVRMHIEALEVCRVLSQNFLK